MRQLENRLLLMKKLQESNMYSGTFNVNTGLVHMYRRTSKNKVELEVISSNSSNTTFETKSNIIASWKSLLPKDEQKLAKKLQFIMDA